MNTNTVRIIERIIENKNIQEAINIKKELYETLQHISKISEQSERNDLFILFLKANSIYEDFLKINPIINI